MSAAAVILAEAIAAGLRMRASDGELRVKPARTPLDPALLARLREHKAELLALLTGAICRHCGEPIAWTPEAAFLTRPATAFADGTGAHLDCYEQAEVERIEAVARRAVSPEAAADPAETMFGEARP